MLKKFWHDPVWSKVIAYSIISLITIGCGYLWYSKSDKQVSKEMSTASTFGNQSPAIEENKGNVNINIYNDSSSNATDNKTNNLLSDELTSPIETSKYESSYHTPVREISGYVPRSVLASKDGREISLGVIVTIRKDGTNLRDSPSLESPGKFLQEGTEVNVVSIQNSWVKITLKGVASEK